MSDHDLLKRLNKIRTKTLIKITCLIIIQLCTLLLGLYLLFTLFNQDPRLSDLYYARIPTLASVMLSFIATTLIANNISNQKLKTIRYLPRKNDWSAIVDNTVIKIKNDKLYMIDLTSDNDLHNQSDAIISLLLQLKTPEKAIIDETVANDIKHMITNKTKTEKEIKQTINNLPKIQ